MPKTYLDEQGNPIAAAPSKVYLDERGEPIRSLTPIASHGTDQDWSDKLGLRNAPVTRAIVDAAEGAASGLAASVYQGGDLIRRGLGMERIIQRPAVQEAMRTPDSFAGKTGRFMEQAAEFVVPAAMTAGMSLPARMAIGGAAGATAGAVQSGGDPVATFLGGAGGAILPPSGQLASAARERVGVAAAGAKEGGVGGALASVVQSAAPAKPKAMMVQALKPRSVKTGFDAALDRALPEIKAVEREAGRSIGGIDDFLAATKAAKQRIQAQLDQMRGPQAAMGSTVDLSPVADAMVRSIPKKVQLETPQAAAAVAAKADAYRRAFSLEEAETLLRETNAELQGFYDLYPSARRSALGHPATAALEAQARTLREAIYAKLDAPGQGEAARELNRRYGALMEVEGEAWRRSNVAKRQQPESLSEQIGAVRAAGEMARGIYRVLHGDPSGAMDIAAARAMRSAGKTIKESQTTDALIRRAMAAYDGTPVPVQMPNPPTVRGLLPPGARRMGPAPDPSFARGVPATPAQSERLALPAPAARPMPAGADPSGVRSTPARPTVQRDPRTGRMRRVYTSESK